MLKLGLRPALGLLAFGACLAFIGVALIYVPAALILGGAGIASWALWGIDV